MERVGEKVVEVRNSKEYAVSSKEQGVRSKA